MESNDVVLVIYLSEGGEYVAYESNDYNWFKKIDTELTENKIKQLIEKSNLYGNEWISNIFTVRIDKEHYKRYIVVKKNDWENYSEIKRKNRLRKLGCRLENVYYGKHE